VLHSRDKKARTLGSRLRHKTSNRSWAFQGLHLRHDIQGFGALGDNKDEHSSKASNIGKQDGAYGQCKRGKREPE
jgi:hypothetical protein